MQSSNTMYSVTDAPYMTTSEHGLVIMVVLVVGICLMIRFIGKHAGAP